MNFTSISAFLRKWFRRRIRLEDIPTRMPPQALAEALNQARRLSSAHAVSVSGLMPGEEPGPPRPAGDEPPTAPAASPVRPVE